MNWEAVRRLAAMQPELLTKTNVPFRLVEATGASLVIEVRSGRWHTVSRANLEKAVQLLRQGESLAGPSDYRHKVADDRPAYAWAILRELGYLA